MWKITTYFLCLISAFLFYVMCDSMFNAPISPKETPLDKELAELFNYDKLKDPEQIDSPSKEPISIEKNNYKLDLYPQAKYKIYAMVLSKSRYLWGWDGAIMPYDLALAWNELMLPENQKGISFTQSNRWYYYQYGTSFPLNSSHIISYSSNHHIIPATNTIFKAIDKVRNKERIYMEGYLVNIKGIVEGKSVWRNSSLSRNDTGEGACEVFYVKKAVLNGKIYE